MVGVGHEALYRAVQIVAEVHALLDGEQGARADVLRSYLGVKPKCGKPILALVHSLLGLPDPELGQEALTAASNRHGKYAMAIKGAELSGIPPSQLAETLSRQGLHRLAEVARQHNRRAKGIEGDGAAEVEQTAEEAGDELNVAGPVRRGRAPPAAAASNRRPGARRTRIELATTESHADRIINKAGIVVCLVDRDPPAPELFEGLPVPGRFRHDRAAAYAWVKAALEEAAEVDCQTEAEDEEVSDEI